MLINGEQRQDLSAFDRGLWYGDGFFETMVAKGLTLPFWKYHLARIEHSANRLGIAAPSEEVLLDDIAKLYQTDPIHSNSSHIIKIIITRGSGGRGYAPPVNTLPTRIIMSLARPHFPEENWSKGVKIGISPIRLGHQPLLAGIKHLSRLEHVLASQKMEVSDADVLLFDEDNLLIEGTKTNVFLVVGNEIITPRLDKCGVAGVMRSWIIDTLYSDGVRVLEEEVIKPALLAASEVFLCNSIIGIWPVRICENKEYKVGHVSMKLMEKWQRLVMTEPSHHGMEIS